MNEDSIAFTAYNQAIEDAKAAIRAETTNADGSEFFSTTFINAIARKCSPHVYVNRLAAAAAAATAAPVEQSNSLTDLQRAVIEHDDDMARFDRNTLTALDDGEGAR